MSTFTFPPLRMAVLQGLLTLKERYDADTQFLRADDVPYDLETIEILERILTHTEVERVVEKVVHAKVGGGGGNGRRGRPKKDDAMAAEDNALIESTVLDLLRNLKNMDETKESLEVSERVAIMKTKAGLIEQLLKAQERQFNVKRLSEFQSTVIGILDDLVPEDARDAFLDRIEPFCE